jgi:hypothetical protein
MSLMAGDLLLSLILEENSYKRLLAAFGSKNHQLGSGSIIQTRVSAHAR